MFDPAVSRCGGQGVIWDSALKLITGFDLTPEQAAGFLLAYWNDRCDPPWTEKEILHTCENAYKKAPAERGTLLKRGERSQVVKAPASVPSLVRPVQVSQMGKVEAAPVLVSSLVRPGSGPSSQTGNKPVRRIRLIGTNDGPAYQFLEEWPNSRISNRSVFNWLTADCYVNQKPTWKKVKLEWLFVYAAPDGSLFMIWLRRDFFPDENGEKRKIFLPFHYVKNPDGTGEFIEGNAPGGKMFPLGVARFPYFENLIFTEGEKAAARVNRYLTENRIQDITVTCLPNGAGSWRDDLKEYFRGKNVFVWPDNDQTGKQYAVKVCHSLEGVARSVWTLKEYPPGFNSHDDAVEVIQHFRKQKEEQK